MMSRLGVKTAIFFSALLLSIAVFTPASLAIAPNGGVLYYPFSQLNVSNIVEDFNGFNGTNRGSVSSTDFPTYGAGGTGAPYSRAFNGSGARINLSTNTASNLSGRNWTISVWVKINSIITNSEVFSSYSYPGSTANITEIDYATTTLRFKIAGQTNTNLNLFNVTPTLGQWQHLVFIRNFTGPTSSDIIFYRNGVLNGSAQANGSLGNWIGGFAIGGDEGSTAQTTNGSFDDFMLYNRTLSASEVLNLYNYNVAVVDPTIQDTAPVQNSSFNTNPVTFSVNVTSPSNYNVSLFLDGVLNNTLTGLVAGTNAFSSIGINFSELAGTHTYFWSVRNNFSTVNSSTLTFYLDSALPVINSSSVPRSNNQSDFFSNFTTSFNITDANLFSWRINLSLLNGTTLANYSNTSLTGLTSVNIQQFIDLTLFKGPLRLTLQVADGHTAQDIEFDKAGVVSNELRFDSVKIYVEDKSDTSTLDFTKLRDRYSFQFQTDLAETQKEFIVESQYEIMILLNSKYKCHLVIPDENKWVDFEEPEITNCQTERLAFNKVRVIVNSQTPKDEFSFESIGELNVVTQSFQFFSINTSQAAQLIVGRGSPTTFYLNVTTNSSFIGNINASLNYGGTYYQTTSTSSSATQYNFAVTLSPTQNNSVVQYFWLFTVDSSNTFQTNQQSQTVVGSGNFSIRFLDERNESLLSGRNITVEFLSDTTVYNFTTQTGTLNVSLAVPIDYTIRYRSDGYGRLRQYLIRVTNVTQPNLTLYLLNDTVSSDLAITVYDGVTLNRVPAAIVYQQRYYLTDNSYHTVAMYSTDTSGGAYFDVEAQNQLYRFRVDQPWLSEKTTSIPQYIEASTLNLYINNQATLGQTYFNVNGIISRVSFINSSQEFQASWTDSQAIASQFCFTIYKHGQYGQEQVNQSCTTSSSTTVNLGGAFSTDTAYFGILTATISGTSEIIATGSQSFVPAGLADNNVGLYFAALVYMTIVFAIPAHMLAAILGALSLSFLKIMGILTVDWTTLIILPIIAFILALILSFRARQ